MYNEKLLKISLKYDDPSYTIEEIIEDLKTVSKEEKELFELKVVDINLLLLSEIIDLDSKANSQLIEKLLKIVEMYDKKKYELIYLNYQLLNVTNRDELKKLVNQCTMIHFSEYDKQLSIKLINIALRISVLNKFSDLFLVFSELLGTIDNIWVN